MNGANEMYTDFEDVYRRHYQSVYRYVRRMIRNNDAAVEDVVQEVFYIAYEKWDTLCQHPNVPGFLMIVARNRIRKWYDQQSRVSVNEECVLEFLDNEYSGNSGKAAKAQGCANSNEGTDPFSMVDLYATMETVLSPHEVDILRQYYEYGYSTSEMARMLGITESCFKVRVLRMKEKLKRGLRGLNMLAVVLPILVMFDLF